MLKIAWFGLKPEWTEPAAKLVLHDLGQSISRPVSHLINKYIFLFSSKIDT